MKNKYFALLPLILVIFVAGCSKPSGNAVIDKQDLNGNQAKQQKIDDANGLASEATSSVNKSDVSNWLLFDSQKDSGTKLKFTIKYPSAWMEKGSVDGGTFSNIPFFKRTKYSEICDEVCRSTGKIFEIKIDFPAITKTIDSADEIFAINELKGVITRDELENGGNKYDPFISSKIIKFEIFDIEGMHFTVSMAYEDEKDEILFKKILGSLVFLDEKNVDISDWRVYKNEEYGFELKYPKNWNAPDGWQSVIDIKVEDKNNANKNFSEPVKDVILSNGKTTAKIDIFYTIAERGDNKVIQNIFYRASIAMGNNVVKISIILPRDRNYNLPDDQAELNLYIKQVADRNSNDKINDMVNDFYNVLATVVQLEQ